VDSSSRLTWSAARHCLPIVRAENQRLADELSSTKGELQQIRTLLKASQESINALKETGDLAALERAKVQRKELARAVINARQSGDAEKEAELTAELAESTTAIREAEKKPAPSISQQQQPELSPAVKQFMAENAWFGTDKKRSALAVASADEMRAEEKWKGRQNDIAFYNEAKARADAILTPPTRRSSKSEGGSGSDADRGSGGGDGVQSYNQLPADWKAAAERNAVRLVGKGRAFADKAALQKHYVEQYQKATA
jgi:hypothetical protein